MGVNIRPLTKEVKKVITFQNLVGKKIAIDAFNMLYQFLAIIRGRDGTPLKDYQGNVTSHLSGLFYRTINILENNIKPVFVFDGKPNEFKLEEIQKRRKVREEATKKYEEARDLGREEEAKKYAQASSKLNTSMIEESKDLLRAMGVPVVQAKQDGEAQAAYLIEKGDAWAVGSQDYDSFLFGAKRMVRNLSQNRTKKVGSTRVKVDLEWYSLDKLLDHWQLSRKQLVDLGILIGVDFFEGVPGIGPKTALDLIKEHGSIEKILNQDIVVRKNAVKDYLDEETAKKVRAIFLTPNVEDDYPAPRWKKANREKIVEILHEKHNFNLQRVENAVDRIIKKGTATQITMDSFFKK